MVAEFGRAMEFALSSEASDEMRVLAASRPELTTLEIRRRANRAVAEALIAADEIWTEERERFPALPL